MLDTHVLDKQSRGHAKISVEDPCQMARRHRQPTGQRRNGQILGEVVTDPAPQLGDIRPGTGRNGQCHAELALPAWPLHIHHHQLRNPEGDFVAMVMPDESQCQVHRCRDARASPHPAGLYEDGIGVDLHHRVLGRQLCGRSPVRRRPMPVKQPRRRGDVGAGAHRGNTSRLLAVDAQPISHLVVDHRDRQPVRTNVYPSGDHDRVRPPHLIKRLIDAETNSGRGRDRVTLGGGNTHLIARGALRQHQVCHREHLCRPRHIDGINARKDHDDDQVRKTRTHELSLDAARLVCNAQLLSNTDIGLSGHPAPNRYGVLMSCVFCAIVAGESPSFRVYEDETTLAFLDIRPITRGHTLVIPKAHAQDLTDLKPDDAAALMTVGQRIANAMRDSELRSDGTNLALNDGRVAFQTVMHAHLHVVPRRTGDKLAFAKGFMIRRDSDLEGTARIIRGAVQAG